MIGGAELATKFREMRALVEGGWCQNVHARDDRGLSCNVHSPMAQCFCLEGAAFRVDLSVNGQNLMDRVAMEQFDVGNCIRFNDGLDRTKTDVINFLDACIERAES